MKVIPVELYYPAFALLMLIAMLIFVPQKSYKSLFWYSVAWGYGGKTVYILVLVILFRLFYYVKGQPFIVFGSPVWLSAAWIPAMMIYFHYLPRRREWYFFAVYLVGFSLIHTEIDIVFNQSGLLRYVHWHPVFRFLLGLVWFYAATIHYWRTKPTKDEE